MKLFNVNIKNINLIITFVVIGFLGTGFRAFFAVLIPSWFGLLVYKDFTSGGMRNVFFVMFSAPLILLMKSTVSLK